MADDPAPELPPLTADAIAALEELASDLPQLPDFQEASRRLEWLIDALIWRGQLPDRYRDLVKKIRLDRGPQGHIVRLSVVDDKYSVASPDVPCPELIPLCGARCCSFNVVLSKQDVAERSLPWDVEKPYMLPRDPDTKRCTCMAADGGCTVYDHRPATCREYDCREDRRVWLDYEKRIPAPLPECARPDRDPTT